MVYRKNTAVPVGAGLPANRPAQVSSKTVATTRAGLHRPEVIAPWNAPTLGFLGKLQTFPIPCSPFPKDTVTA